MHWLHHLRGVLPCKYPDQYNQEISKNKAVHVYFAQAIPLITYIDESCLYLKEGKCRICEGVCKNDAIDLKQTPQKKEINVGAIILAPGFEPFDQRRRRNITTGSSRTWSPAWTLSGCCAPRVRTPVRSCALPTESTPTTSPGFNASVPGGSLRAKQLLLGGVLHLYPETGHLTKDHDAGAHCTIFHNDVRSYGKDF